MKSFYHPNEALHHPKTYLSRGQMRQPQELPIRADKLVEGFARMSQPLIEPQDHGIEPLLRVHDVGYLDFLQTAWREWGTLGPDWGDEAMSNVYVRQPNPMRGILGKAARYLADGSCPVGEHTWTSSYWGAQAAIAATHAVLAGDTKAFALCRPPGHHARSDAAGGFCYINNAAIAASLLRDRYAKVAVLDTDMHHGQGIQEIFYDRADVFYVSIHGDPTNFYPVVAGFADETGVGDGLGFNLNLPMPHGSEESVFFEQLDTAIEAIEAYRPDALVFCLGFDIYEKDPQSKVSVSTAGFERLARVVSQLELPTVIVQEGGYHYETLPNNLAAFFKGLGLKI
jgi:acetoin utilization deacetylase AcuC-like enzyme